MARTSSWPATSGEHKIKVQDGPWPAFPADLTSIAVALATQCTGSVLIHEWMFENRLIFTDKLVLMGADITLCDPHRAIVSGPSRLRAERVESPDIRAGMAMLIAALCADGRSEIGNIRQIDRGYERIDERLRDLGARIERVATEPALASQPRARGRYPRRAWRSCPSPGTRDILPDEMRELSSIVGALGACSPTRLRRDHDARARVRGGALARRHRRAAGVPGRRRPRRRPRRCART